MPRKPKQPTKQKISVVVKDRHIEVSMYPPTGNRKSWYAYWNGLVTSKATGQTDFDEAVKVVKDMVQNGGERPVLADAVLSDEEFELIQRRHFAKKTDDADKERAKKSLKSCLEAISAFREISGVTPVSLATPDDCERFQLDALTRPRNWRKQYPNSQKTGVRSITPNTVVKWSRELQAAFERANRNAGKRKAVRGVVDPAKLLESNPWKQFEWIGETEPNKRRFSNEELLSLIDYFEANWTAVVTAPLFAKMSFWLWARRAEVASLRWDSLRVVTGQYHFDFVGKWGVRKWARIPVKLYRELSLLKTENPYVFAAHNGQLHRYHADRKDLAAAKRVSWHYNPTAFADWFHDKLVEWAATAPNGHATQHAFRKTGLQFAYRGGVTDSRIASDASITDSVMHGNYVDDFDEELFLKSNRTFARIVASLRFDVAKRYGYDPELEGAGLADVMKAAIDRQDWKAVEELMAKLKNGNGR